MAGDTSGGQMLSGQRESGRGMVESRRDPGGGVVARGAILAETLLEMVGIGGSFKCRLVAGKASGRCSCVLGSVTGDAGGLRMRAGQRERCCAVIIIRRLPDSGCVTERTVVRKAAGLMIRFDCRGEFRAVATVAIVRCPDITCRVTTPAGYSLMSAGQRE